MTQCFKSWLKHIETREKIQSPSHLPGTSSHWRGEAEGRAGAPMENSVHKGPNDWICLSILECWFCWYWYYNSATIVWWIYLRRFYVDIKNDTGMLEYYAYIMFNMFADDTDTVTDFLKRGCAMPGYWPTPSRQIERIAHRVGWTKTRNCQTPNHNKKR